jgi:nucleoside-diphosphate-sugar epimerase
VADARPYELREILATVRRALEAEGLPTSGPDTLRLPRLAARVAERIDALVQKRGRYLQPLHVLGELNHTIACDISRARDELGYEPAVALEEGMRNSIRWCLEHGEQL